MKLSDKLLILVVLGAFVIVGSAHLNVYSRYKNGLSVVDRPLHKTYPIPAHLSLTGFLSVTITPADSFAIEYETPDANEEGPVRRKEMAYRETTQKRAVIPWYNGDTMMMSGIDTIYPNGNKDQLVMIPTQSVHIYCPGIAFISVQGGLLSFDASANAAHAFSGHLRLWNVQLAQTSAIINPGEDAREFGQLSIECINSHIDMREHTHVRQLQLQLDSSSSAALTADVDSLSLQYHDASRIELSGALIRRLGGLQSEKER